MPTTSGGCWPPAIKMFTILQSLARGAVMAAPPCLTLSRAACSWYNAEACRWYETRSVGLGKRFLHELTVTLSRIATAPEAYAKGERDVRSARMRRFPYLVHFRVFREEVVVLAVMYGGRDAAVWHNRT